MQGAVPNHTRQQDQANDEGAYNNHEFLIMKSPLRRMPSASHVDSFL